MTDRLAGTTAIVTGAGRGLGRAIAVAFAREGAALWTCARTKSELDRTAIQIRKMGGRIEVCQVDLSDVGSCQSFIQDVLQGTRRVDVLVNNAAILRLTSIGRLSVEEWQQIVAVNLTAPFLLIRNFIPHMLESGGSVVNVSSAAGVSGFAKEAAYCASKFGVEGLTKALAKELEKTKVSINTITPGLKIKPTSVTEQEYDNLPLENRQEWHDPEEIAPAFLCLAGLHGEVNGLRFNAHRLSLALAKEGFELTPGRLKELAE